MPGLAGIIQKQGLGLDVNLFERMVAALKYQTTLRENRYVNTEFGVAVGCTALPEAFSSANPIWNQAKNVCLLFSGEDFADHKETLSSGVGGLYKRVCDPSDLVRLYEKFGIGFIARLNGWFSGLLIDFNARQVFLFNDRYGLGRIYYHETPDCLYFASEAKAILKILPQTRRLDFRGVAEVYSCGCVLQGRTLFDGISLLPSASVWTFDKPGKIQKEFYFKPEQWEQQSALTVAEYYDHLKSCFSRLLPRYLRNNLGSVAMSLTGGLDGRMIMAYANAKAGELPCYSFGGMYRDCLDVTIARKVAQHCRQKHSVISVGDGFFSDFITLAEQSVYVSDGAMDVSGAVEVYANKIARQIAPIRLTGNYGSEIVRGNIAFKPSARSLDLLVPEFAEQVKKAATTYESEKQSHWLSFIAFKQVPWHHYSRLSVEQSQVIVRSPYLDNDLVALMYRAPYQEVLAKGHSLKLIAEGNSGLATIPTDRGLLYRPLPVFSGLHHQLAEFTAKAEYAYDYGMPQWLAKADNAVAPLHMERLFLGRHKFYHFRIWYRDQLASYVKSILLEPKALTRSYFQPKALKAMVESHTKGYRNYTLEIHKALTFELLQKMLIDQA